MVVERGGHFVQALELLAFQFGFLLGEAFGVTGRPVLGPTPPVPVQASGAAASQTLVDTDRSVKYNRTMPTVRCGVSAAEY